MTQLMQQQPYTVDVVMCIDGTSSMSGIIDKVKQQAVSFPDLYADAMEKSGRVPGTIRVKVIVFRDFKDDGEAAMQQSEGFFDLSDPTQQDAFCRYVNGIEARGGGDLPENALEAIAMAMRADWTTKGGRYRRHAILLFTDADALPLREPDRTTSPYYPTGMPASLAELKELYDRGDQEYAPMYSPNHGRMVIFAPETKDSVWKQVRAWPRAWVVPTEAHGGCKDVDIEDALAVLVGTY